MQRDATPAARDRDARRADAARARAPLGAERARGGRRRPRARRAVREDRRRAGEFRGAERRFEQRGVVNGITVVDDYGHHPTEIAAVLAAARAAQPARIVVAFQPHRYTRTRDLMPEFGVGAGGRRRSGAHRHLRGQRGADSRRHGRGAGRRRQRGAGRAGARRADSSTTWRRRVADLARPGDLVITLGAGSIGGARRPRWSRSSSGGTDRGMAGA